MKWLPVSKGGSAQPVWTVSTIRWLAFLDRPCLVLETENEDGTWCVWKSHKKETIETIHRNGGVTARQKRSWNTLHEITSHQIVITTHAEVKELINMLRKQSRNVYCGYLQLHWLIYLDRASVLWQGPFRSGCIHPHSWVIYAVHVCSVKPQRKRYTLYGPVFTPIRNSD